MTEGLFVKLDRVRLASRSRICASVPIFLSDLIAGKHSPANIAPAPTSAIGSTPIDDSTILGDNSKDVGVFSDKHVRKIRKQMEIVGFIGKMRWILFSYFFSCSTFNSSFKYLVSRKRPDVKLMQTSVFN